MESDFYAIKWFNLFVHPGRIFVISIDCFEPNKILKDVHDCFVENRKLFINVKIRKTFFQSNNSMARLIRSVFAC